MQKKKESFDIRQVVELTGVSEFTLRGWESRYRAIEPARNATGRRMYSRKDILKVQLLKSLVDRGHRIGSVASLSHDELQALMEKREDLSLTGQEYLCETPFKQDPSIKRILNLSERFNWDEIQKLLLKKREALSPRDFVLNFLLGLTQEINQQVDAGQFSITQEHIFSAILKENLFYLKATMQKAPRKDLRLVLATPEGDIHEIGLLIASTLASIHGISALYLGPNTPKAEVCDACLRFKATHLLVSSTVSNESGAREDLMSFVNFLDRHLSPNITLWLGGRFGRMNSFHLKRDFHSFKSLEEFDEKVKK